MEKNKISSRLVYFAAFLVILVTELLIAMFVHDDFIRPYGGDILVTVLICCFVRIFVPDRWRSMPVFVFLFALCVEIGQYFDFVSLTGLGDIAFFRILLGSTFSAADVVCYGAGCVLFCIAERNRSKNEARMDRLREYK